MDNDNSQIIEFFAPLGFQEIEIEDELTALCFEEAPDSEYVLLTNEEGILPGSLAAPLILAGYSAEGAFLWSTGFKNAAQFREVWSAGRTSVEKIQAVQKHRQALALEGYSL